jgi:hypothetical protein
MFLVKIIDRPPIDINGHVIGLKVHVKVWIFQCEITICQNPCFMIVSMIAFVVTCAIMTT